MLRDTAKLDGIPMPALARRAAELVRRRPRTGTKLKIYVDILNACAPQAAAVSAVPHARARRSIWLVIRITLPEDSGDPAYQRLQMQRRSRVALGRRKPGVKTQGIALGWVTQNAANVADILFHLRGAGGDLCS